MGKVKSFFKKYVSVPSAVFFLIAVTGGAVHVLALTVKPFADFYVSGPGSWVRTFLSWLTYLLPFSLAETVVISLPVLMFSIMFFGIRRINKGKTEGWRFVVTLLSIVSLMYSTFILGFGTGYYASTLEDRMGLERKAVSAAELNETAEKLLERMNVLLDDVTFTEDGSVMPYSFDEMTSKLNEAYGRVSDRYSFIPHMTSRLKYIALSEPMTYTHISGVYTYYTGESNININFPDYTAPYTAAHEMSHQRGLAREDEANFMAMIACEESEDSYIKYSGYMNTFEYVINALYSADRDLYYSLMRMADSRIITEIDSYNRFFEKYRENIAETVSSAVNDTYLKIQGQQDGVKSYGRVVDLTVAYFKDK